MQHKLLINGELVSGEGEKQPVYNPATGEVLLEIAEASAEQVDAAVRAADAAFAEWGQTTPKVRAECLLKLADVIEENGQVFAELESRNCGKPLHSAFNDEIPAIVDVFRFFAGAARCLNGLAAGEYLEGHTSMIRRDPLGVVASIAPWNYPLMMAAWKLAPALAAGDTIVIKPSSHTSLSLMELVRLIADVLPAGVLNVITGAGSKSGQWILDHPDFDKLAFTGSTEIGRSVYQAAVDKLIPVTLELGGKSANMIFDDCDLEQAVEGVATGILFNQGQVCCAGSRVFVQEGIFDKFIAKLKATFEGVKVGDPTDPSTQLGAQIYKSQQEKVLKYIKIGLEEGGELVTGGERYTENGCDKGFFLKPTILISKTNAARVCQEEIFGPVVVVQKFKTVDEVIELANDSVYGLGGGVFTGSLNTAMKVSRGVQTGRVWVNTYNAIPAGAPFGGYKESGIGRETHKVMLEHYSQTKNIMINLKEGTTGLYDVK